MRVWLALLVFACAYADSPPVINHGGDDINANEDLGKELSEFSRKADQILNQANNVAQSVSAVPVNLNNLQVKALTLARDQRFIQSIESIWQNKEKRKRLLLVELAWFFFMMSFKAWRQSRVDHWFKRMIVGLACTILMWIGLFYLIPLVILGEPFGIVTGTLWRVFLSP
jgi:hypothetical protein